MRAPEGPAPLAGGDRAGIGRLLDGGHPTDSRSAAQSAIEAYDFRPATAGGSVRAYLSVRIGGITLHGCKIVQQAGQRPWLALPQREWTPANGGKTRYSPVVELSDTLRRRVTDVAVAAWEASGGRP